MMLRWTFEFPGYIGVYPLIAVLMLGIPISLLIWVLLIADAVIKSTERYASYNRKSKKIAILFAVLFGPFGWLYTYSKDAMKFWGSIVPVVANYIVAPLFLINNVRRLLRRLVEGYSTIDQT